MLVLTDLTALLADAVDAVCAADPALLADGDTIQALHRQLERLEAATTRAAAAFDASGAWEADGARSAAAWISTRCHLPVSTGRRRVHRGASYGTCRRWKQHGWPATSVTPTSRC